MPESGPSPTAALAKAKRIKFAASKTKAAKKNSSHPPTASLVNNAIKHLNERGGSSLQAIKKFVSSTYKIDAEKLAPFIKKYLKTGVEKGVLIRTKGTGASGSFKLAGKVQGAKKAAIKKPKASSKPAKKVKSKKATKSASEKPAKVAKKAPIKVKVTKVPAAKKPKARKPKKVTLKKVAKKSATRK